MCEKNEEEEVVECCGKGEAKADVNEEGVAYETDINSQLVLICLGSCRRMSDRLFLRRACREQAEKR